MNPCGASAIFCVNAAISTQMDEEEYEDVLMDIDDVDGKVD